MYNMTRLFDRPWFHRANSVYCLRSVVRILPNAMAVVGHSHSGLMGTCEPNVLHFGNAVGLFGDLLGSNLGRDIGSPDWGLSSIFCHCRQRQVVHTHTAATIAYEPNHPKKAKTSQPRQSQTQEQATKRNVQQYFLKFIIFLNYFNKNSNLFF
jgi:hypothetical protein